MILRMPSVDPKNHNTIVSAAEGAASTSGYGQDTSQTIGVKLRGGIVTLYMGMVSVGLNCKGPPDSTFAFPV